jgi:hypothetical protein
MNPNLIVFLDKHKFTKKEMKDFDYVAEKIGNFYENFDKDFINYQEIDYDFTPLYVELAKEYQKLKSK